MSFSVCEAVTIFSVPRQHSLITTARTKPCLRPIIAKQAGMPKGNESSD